MGVGVRIGGRIFQPRLFPTLIAAVVFVFLLGLGRWQLQRMAEKQALFTEFTAGGHTTVPLSTTAARYQHVSAAGRYDSAHQFLLDNMTHEGRAGYRVLTPFVIGTSSLPSAIQGKGSSSLPSALQGGFGAPLRTGGQDVHPGLFCGAGIAQQKRVGGGGPSIVLVDRGWVPARATRAQLPDIRVSEDERAISGRLDHPPGAGIDLPAPASHEWPRVLSYPKMRDLQEALGRPVFPMIVLLDADRPDGYVREWQPATFPPERHLSYAVTWFALAAALLVIYIVTNLKPRPEKL